MTTPPIDASIHDYEFHEKLGAGTYATVYRATKKVCFYYIRKPVFFPMNNFNPCFSTGHR